jgi:hypothetical protein
MDTMKVRWKVEHLETIMVVLKVVKTVLSMVDNLVVVMECKLVDLLAVLLDVLKGYSLE